MTFDFPGLLDRFTGAVEAGDGTALGARFTEDGTYVDTFYGAFTGRAAIRDMLENQFWRDAEAFSWHMRDPVCDGHQGYARWRFGYTSRLPESAGREVAFEGMSRFEFEDGLIRRYDEVFDAGMALTQLAMPASGSPNFSRVWPGVPRPSCRTAVASAVPRCHTADSPALWSVPGRAAAWDGGSACNQRFPGSACDAPRARNP